MSENHCRGQCSRCLEPCVDQESEENARQALGWLRQRNEVLAALKEAMEYMGAGGYGLTALRKYGPLIERIEGGK